MTSTGQLPLRLWQGGLAVIALSVGLLAGIDPPRAFALTCGLIVVVLALTNLTAGVCLFGLLAFLDYRYPNVTTLVGIALGLSWLAALGATSGRGRFFPSSHPAAATLLALFPAWVVASLLWAEASPPVTSALVKHAVNFGLFLIVYAAVRTRRDPLLIVGAFVASASFSALYSFVAPRPPAGGVDELARAAGPIGDPNALARLLVAGLVLAFALAAIPSLRRGHRALAGAAGTVCAVGTVFTFSRGGLIALLCSLVAALAFSGRWRPRVAVVGLTIVVGVAGFYLIGASPEARSRISAEGGGAGRLDLWTVGWRMVQDHPLKGVGAGNFGEASIQYLTEPGLLRRSDLIVSGPNVVHNTYLEVLAELGLIGLVMLACLLGFSVACSVRAARGFAERGDVTMEILSRAVFAAMIGLLAADIFISEPYNRHSWLLLALSPALLALSRSPEPPSPHPPNAPLRRPEGLLPQPS